MITFPNSTLKSVKPFFENNREMVFRFMVQEIAKGISEKRSKVDLFKFGKTDYIMAVRDTEFEEALEVAMDFFAKKEMYEKAAECRDLIFKARERKINSLLEE